MPQSLSPVTLPVYALIDCMYTRLVADIYLNFGEFCDLLYHCFLLKVGPRIKVQRGVGHGCLSWAEFKGESNIKTRAHLSQHFPQKAVCVLVDFFRHSFFHQSLTRQEVLITTTRKKK